MLPLHQSAMYIGVVGLAPTAKEMEVSLTSLALHFILSSYSGGGE